MTPAPSRQRVTTLDRLIEPASVLDSVIEATVAARREGEQRFTALIKRAKLERERRERQQRLAILLKENRERLRQRICGVCFRLDCTWAT